MIDSAVQTRPDEPCGLLVGGGGHARVVIAAAGQGVVLGLVDPRPIGVFLDGVPILGGDEILAHRSEPAHVAIGDNATRRAVVAGIGPRSWLSIVSPHALVLGPVEVGEGAFIGARAVVQPGVRIGRHVIVNTGAIVEHDCTVGDFAHIAPGTLLCGGVSVGEGSLVGACAVVIPDIVIGRNVVIGAGAVVVSDVPDGATVVGNPARPQER